MDFGYIFSVILLALGFGFVIFWHELGHFLAAKWAGVKVEQFAVGFGTAALAWRKGIGIRIGTTRREYEARAREYLVQHEAGHEPTAELADAVTDDQRLDAAGRAMGMGETEYRLNWLPLGGYVKMLGQDDLNPNATATDPRAYNMQPIFKRMVIVSAGVIMNIILAAVGFCILFLVGFNAPPAMVGKLAALSPAQQAGLNVGDTIVSINGEPQLDFTKIYLTVALLKEGEDAVVVYKTPANQEKTTTIRPSRAGLESRGMLALGITPPMQMHAIAPDKTKQDWFDPKRMSPLMKEIQPGETIVAVNGETVNPATDYYKLDRAVQSSNGRPVVVTIKDASGKSEDRALHPRFDEPFGAREVSFAGMLCRSEIVQIPLNSLAFEKLLPGDVIASVSMAGTGDINESPSRDTLMEVLNRAGQSNQPVTITVLRDGKSVTVEPMTPNLLLDRKENRKGLGVGLTPDEMHAVIGGIEKESAAARAGVPQGATIVSLDGQLVQSWHDVNRILKAARANQPVVMVARTSAGESTFELRLTEDDIRRQQGYRYELLPTGYGMFREYTQPRRTHNPLEAAAWGVGETRDLIIQFYLTIKRMTQGSVPASNLMGPLGIVQAGARFAYKGNDWLIWFLSMISANLAVVNFLPIPIVDGGLFLFLIIEKLQGKPISPRMQSIAQVVGLALILSVFIFVTYQDLVR